MRGVDRTKQCFFPEVSFIGGVIIRGGEIIRICIMCVYIYIYIVRERDVCISLSLYIYIYMYIYIYTYIYTHVYIHIIYIYMYTHTRIYISPRDLGQVHLHLAGERVHRAPAHPPPEHPGGRDM